MVLEITLKINQCTHIIIIKQHASSSWNKYRRVSADEPEELETCSHFSECGELNKRSWFSQEKLHPRIPAVSSPEVKKTNKLS